MPDGAIGRGKEVTMEVLPDCDFCKEGGYDPVRKAMYDFKTSAGQWAFGCHSHYHQHKAMPGLGTGKAQKLILKNN